MTSESEDLAGERIWNMFIVLALYSVFCATCCLFGCAQNTAAHPAGERTYSVPLSQPLAPEPLAELVPIEEVERIEQMARQRRELDELQRNGLSLERLTGN